MNYNLHADSMLQNQYNFSEQNSSLTKHLAKKCRPVGLPSQQGIDNNKDQRDRECL